MVLKKTISDDEVQERLKEWKDIPAPIWREYGDIICDIERDEPVWDVPKKIVVECAITGAFNERAANPAQPVSPEEICEEAIEAIEAGATAIHLHVRDEEGKPATDIEKFRQVVEPIRDRYGKKVFVDGCCVFGETVEETLSPVLNDLFEMTPVNATACYTGDTILAVPPQYLKEKTKFIQEMGVKPMVALYTDGDWHNAKRWLIDTGILEEPYYWNILPTLPGGSPMNNPDAMFESLLHHWHRIKDADPRDHPTVLVCASGRASHWLAVASILLGLHIRVGKEDTIFKYPHSNEKIKKNAESVKTAVDAVHNLGLEVASADDLRKELDMI